MKGSVLRVNVGKGKLEIADVCAIAARNGLIFVDIEALRQEMSCNPNIKRENIPQQETNEPLAASFLSDYSSPTDVYLSHIEARAILVIQIHKLLRFPSLSEGVVDHIAFFVALLNSNIIPQIHDTDFSGASSLLALADGKGLVTTPSTTLPIDINIALKEANISNPDQRLNCHERDLFCSNPAGLLAVATIAVGGAKGVVPLADAVAALSCEALQVNSSPFEAEFVELSRPHRGIVTSASNLRLMLDNSKYINSRGEFILDPECIRCIPQYHGPASDAITSAYNVVETEINSALPSTSDIKISGNFHPQALQNALMNVSDALRVFLKGSTERCLVLNDVVCVPSLLPSSIPSSTPGVRHGSELVQTLTKCLVTELKHSLQFFSQEESAQREKAATSAAKVNPEAEAKAAAAQAKEDEKLKNMSEAQRNKILEKRRKTAEKKKQKENAKKASKQELQIGVGSRAFRQLLVREHNSGEEEVDLTACFNPFDLSPSGLSVSVEILLQKLGSGGTRRKPKIPRGAQDFLPHQMLVREKIMNKIRIVFKRHAGVEIETPVFELKETLTGKYGEDSKLIYDLADQGGELLALRYDLTVPFARFMALHSPGNIKRFHIARVYRRDNPQPARGRFREFYQCDFDIAGSYGTMIADAEVLTIGIEVVQQFPEVGPFKVKLSHRLLLDAIMSICGVPKDKLRAICSAIDKLDKEPWSEVQREMVEDKGLAEEVADRIGTYVKNVGEPRELHRQFTTSGLFKGNADAEQALKELGMLFDYLEAMGVLQFISFDLSLARGLDYYTGIIYEFVLLDPQHSVGSIAAGGRYDNLVGMFSATDQQIPCVGVSLGIERIFAILLAHETKKQLELNAAMGKETAEGASFMPAAAQVLVASTGSPLLLERLQVLQLLWSANIAAEIIAQETLKFTRQLHYALSSGIPYIVVIGEDELAKGEVKLKDVESKDEISIKREELVDELLRRGCRTTNTLAL